MAHPSSIEASEAVGPLRFSGPVIKGFGRGSKELGIPTANLPLESFKDVITNDSRAGVYCGWAQLQDHGIFKMVMSVGWNPYYKNTERSAEAHLLHSFGEDFYGKSLRIVVVAYLRPECDFVSLEALIAEIKTDIDVTDRLLELPAYQALRQDAFLSESA